MKRRLQVLTSLFVLAATLSLPAQTNAPSLEATYRETAAKLIGAATNSNFAHQRLATLCDTFGHRLSGSTNLEKAIDWVLAEMKKDGFANVRGEPVMVPHWVRGAESLAMLSPKKRSLKVLGLGGSIGTPPEGITAEVLVVADFDDLQKRAADAKGKIVLFNLPFTRYSDTVVLRYKGAIEASKAGAVASMIRSVTPYSMQTPHTGTLGHYDTNTPAIPHCAITIEDAEFMQRAQARGEKIVVQLKMAAQTLPDAPSRNIIAELVGSEKPDEVVVLGGHIDSWDVGQGAMDDGGGCVAAWEAVHLMKKLGLKPRRTIRVVLWTNEENGGKGARAYHEAHQSEMPKHVLAMECDDGTFKPTGFAFSGSQKAADMALDIAQLLKPINANQILWGAGGADISKMQPDGVPMMDLADNMERYFWYHHTEADTVDKVDSHELNLCTATMAVMAYVVADMPEMLPREVSTGSLTPTGKYSARFMSLELDQNTHNRIKRLCEEGDMLCTNKMFDAAIGKYESALSLLPEPINHWEASTWIFAALGDAHLAKKDFQKAQTALSNAIACPNGLGNPFLHLRLGQTQFELGNEILAKDELTRAYMGGGKEIFKDENPKYFSLVKRILKEPPGGW